MPGNYCLTQSEQNYQVDILEAERQLASPFALKRSQVLLMKSHVYLWISPLAWKHGIWRKYLSQFYCTNCAMNTWGYLHMNSASPGLLRQQDPLNTWLVLIFLSQVWFIPDDACRTLSGHWCLSTMSFALEAAAGDPRYSWFAFCKSFIF